MHYEEEMTEARYREKHLLPDRLTYPLCEAELKLFCGKFPYEQPRAVWIDGVEQTYVTNTIVHMLIDYPLCFPDLLDELQADFQALPWQSKIPCASKMDLNLSNIRGNIWIEKSVISHEDVATRMGAIPKYLISSRKTHTSLNVPVPMEVDNGRVVDARHLKLIARLPDVMIVREPRKDFVRFTFEGGRVLLTVMSTTDK